jgi:putative CocE/NonD family hydrolase
MPEYSRLRVERDAPMPMRDGVILRADIYRPDAGGKFPALLMRTPYSRAPSASIMEGDPLRFVQHGYVVVEQDTRGRFASEGTFWPFRDDGHDGYDSVEWTAAQPWCSGKVGMFGSSYVGATQWLAAAERPPHLAAIHPQITASDYHEGWIYHGGAFALGFALSWALALAGETLERGASSPAGSEAAEAYRAAFDGFLKACSHLPLSGFPGLRGERLAPYYYEWLEHPADDHYWQRWSIERRHDAVMTPAFQLGGWHDILIGGTLRNYTGMKARGGSARARAAQRLVVGPWAHCPPQYPSMVGEVDYGKAAAGGELDIDALLLRWHDRWTAGLDNGADSDAPVKLFIMGKNAWRDEPDWPLARAVATPYYLHGRGRANSRGGDGLLAPGRPGDEPPDVYLSDPRNPVPTRGGAVGCIDQLKGGAYDQREIEDRQDVLVYTTEPVREPLEVTGPVRVILYASSSAVDTDFTAKLVDVSPDGFARNLTDGLVRARYREDRSVERFLTPGKPEEFVIDLAATANLFDTGHSVRVEIASSNFPRFDRNSNTGRPFGQDAELAEARQTVFHDARYPSHIVLPIVPSPAG